MRITIIPNDDPRYFYNDYRIVWKDEKDRKYGIINHKTNDIIIPYMYEEISWERDIQMVRVKFNGKYALCLISEMRNKLIPKL